MSKDIGKFLKTIVTFLVAAATLYVIGLVVFDRLLPARAKKNLSYLRGAKGHLYTRLQEAKITHDVDLLFLGSSHVYRGFDTRIFSAAGYKCFNLGSSAQTPIQTKLLLQRFLRSMNPKMVIYEVYPPTFSMDGLEASLELISNIEITVNELSLLARQQNMKLWNTTLLALVYQGLNLSPSVMEKTGKDTYVPGGFVERKMEYFAYTKSPKIYAGRRDQQIEEFQDIISILKANNVPYLLVQAPVSKSRFSAITNNQEFDDIMRSYGVYENFNYSVDLDDSLHYYDNNHLNQDGVVKFNHAMISFLRNIER